MKYRNIIRYVSVLGSTLGAIGAASTVVNDYNEFVLPLAVLDNLANSKKVGQETINEAASSFHSALSILDNLEHKVNK